MGMAQLDRSGLLVMYICWDFTNINTSNTALWEVAIEIPSLYVDAREANPLARIPVGSGAKQLLALSSRLDLGEGLITPVQAWDKIKAHARAHLSSPDKIQHNRGAFNYELPQVRAHNFELIVRFVFFMLMVSLVHT